GGVLADTFGFSSAFHLIAIPLFLTGLFVLIGLKEIRLEEKKEKQKSYTSKEVFAFIVKQPMLLTTMFVAMFVQIAHFSIQPILSLYVAELNGPANLAFFSGLAFSITGLGNLLMSRRWGRFGDKFGYDKILVFLLLGAAIVYFPGGFVTNIWQLI